MDLNWDNTGYLQWTDDNTLFAPMLVGVALIAVALVFAVAPQMRRGFRFIRSFSNFCE